MTYPEVQGFNRAGPAGYRLPPAVKGELITVLTRYLTDAVIADMEQSAIPFTYTQSAPASTWQIVTPLKRKPSSISVFVGDEQVEADVSTPDDVTVIVSFSTPQSGRAEIL